MQFPSPNELGFQVKKLIMTNLKVGKKILHILGLFSPESSIWWRHEIRMSKLLNFDFLENKKDFWSEMKNCFPSFTKALF